MQNKAEVMKGLNALEGLILEQSQLGKDACMFLIQKDMWKEFMDFHCEEHIKRCNEKGGK